MHETNHLAKRSDNSKARTDQSNHDIIIEPKNGLKELH